MAGGLLLSVACVALCDLGFRLASPLYSNEDEYVEAAFRRVLNSDVRAEPGRDTVDLRWGYRSSPNVRKVVKKAEYEYTIHANSLGFRTKELAPKAEHEYRVLFIGDSMFFGVGVEEEHMVSSYLERMAGNSDTAERPLNAYNYSVGGYNTAQELIVARTFAPIVRPDHIILGFFTANDIVPNHLAFVDDEGNYSVRPERIKALNRELKERLSPFSFSAILRALAFQAYVPRLRYEIASRPEVISDSYFLIDQFRELAGALEAELTMVLMHPRDTVEAGIAQRWSGSKKPGQMIRAYCEQNGIEVVDLLDSMRGREARRKYFYARDGHFTREGHELIAGVIHREVIRDRLAPN